MIKVLHPGFYASIQDMGRKGYANYGIPFSGCMDSHAAKTANLLLNNNPEDALIEITYGGTSLAFENNTLISITGADFSAKIGNTLIPVNTVFSVKKGDILSFGKRKYGSRTYIGVFGGILSESIYGSRSFYQGVTQMQRLEKGTVLSFSKKSSKVSHSFSHIKVSKSLFQSHNITCYQGPEYSWLSQKQQKQLNNTLFSISNQHSRMGYRLNQEIPNQFTSMLTSAVLPGTVQLTPSGKLIILMRDAQVTGGYPRVLQLTEESICKIAQKTTNDTIQFSIKQHFHN